MQHASKKKSNRVTKLGIVILCICSIGAIFYFFMKPANDPEVKVESKSVEGQLIDVQESQFTIRHDDAKQYIFSRENSKVDKEKFIVGNVVIISYVGDLIENSKELQKVEISATSITEIVKNSNQEVGHDDVMATMLKEMTLEEKVAQMFMVRVPQIKPVELIRDYISPKLVISN